MKRVAIAVFLCLAANAQAARFLFDAAHAETAGSADWVIDADLHNLSWNSSGTFTTSGSDSNAQRIPTPAASGIISNTAETYWQGALSAWAVDLVKRGHSVETLPTSPAAVQFSYGTAGVQDLTNYDVVVVDEPNILFTLAEKQALLSFVSNGGSLFMICDHVNSDRNSDGQDSVSIWNDFLTNNGLTNNPFGIIFRTSGTGSNNSGTNTFSKNVAGVPLLFGPIGTATNVAYFAGNQFQIDNTKNPTAISHMWFGAANDSNNFCALASLQYGKGRVVVCGDSSPIEDGTGDPGDSLFNGYTGDMGGIQHIWIMNSSEWLAAPFAPVANPTNTWTSAASGKWETGANWLNGTPSSADPADLITNATTKTVTIDSTTTNTASSLTISNLTVAGPPGTLNTLQLSNAGFTVPLTVLSTATISNGGAILITNSAMRVASSLSAQGTLTVQNGGTVTATGALTLGETAGTTGTLWMTGGNLLATNNSGTGRIQIGYSGSGAMIVSNGTVRFDQMFVGDFVSGSGTLTIAGGTNLSPSTFILGQSTFSTGTVWVTSGVVALTNNIRTAFVEIAGNGVAQMTVSNGLVLADRALVASLSTTGRGTITSVGGTTIINTNMVLGNGCGSLGNLVVAGGNVFVTNATATAVLEVRGGTLEIDSGMLVVDQLVMTNACGHFVQTGGTLILNSSPVLAAGLDADGDGIPNGYEQSHGLDPLNAADANLDADGDGMSNLQEYLAGTDPTNSSSYFHITGVAGTGNDVLITWMTGLGKTNALQATTIGSYATNDFADVFVVTNTLGTITNYLDVGAVTNSPSRFYRVRLVP